MSFLTDVAVITSGEDDAVAFVNRWLLENTEHRQQLCKTDLDAAGAGGCKVTSLIVYAACFNYLDAYGFEDAVRAAPWRFPGQIAVYVDGEAEPAYVFSPAKAGHWSPWPEPGEIAAPIAERLAGQQPRRTTRAQRRAGK